MILKLMSQHASCHSLKKKSSHSANDLPQAETRESAETWLRACTETSSFYDSFRKFSLKITVGDGIGERAKGSRGVHGNAEDAVGRFPVVKTITERILRERNSQV